MKNIFFLCFWSVCVWGQQDVYLNEFMASNAYVQADPDFGRYGDWIELYNDGEVAIDLTDYYLTDNRQKIHKWRFPKGWEISAKSYLVVWADKQDIRSIHLDQSEERLQETIDRTWTQAHTNFKLNGKGGFIGLFRDSLVIDSVNYGAQINDISMGRLEGNKAVWAKMNPSINSINENVTIASEKISEMPVFSKNNGIYSDKFEVEVKGKGAIYYTTDGAIPTKSSLLYKRPISIDSTTILRVRMWTENDCPSSVVTRSYLLGIAHDIDVISLVLDPKHLFDEDDGIYVMEDVQRRKEWKRPANITFFEKDGQTGFQINAEIGLYGRTAIAMPQKSLGVTFSGKYGAKQLEYPLFDGQKNDTIASFLLRSSSDDWEQLMFNDAFLQLLLKDYCDLDIQRYRPTALYLNGRYYGIHNLREKFDAKYVEKYYDVQKSDFTLLKNMGELVSGSQKAMYRKMERYVRKNDMNVPEDISHISKQFDLVNYADFMIAETYLVNRSWLHNRKYWRKNTEDGQWRFMLYDLDRAYLFVDKPMMEELFSTQFSLFPYLLKDENYKNYFLQRYAAHINITFKAERAIYLLDSLSNNLRTEMPKHIERWAAEDGLDSMRKWEKYLNKRKEFAVVRPDTARKHLCEVFGLDTMVTISLAFDETQGHLEVAGVPLNTSDTHLYFKNIALQIEAIPKKGYRFKAWEGVENNSKNRATLLPKSGMCVRAIFEEI